MPNVPALIVKFPKRVIGSAIVLDFPAALIMILEKLLLPLVIEAEFDPEKLTVDVPQKNVPPKFDQFLTMVPVDALRVKVPPVMVISPMLKG